MRFWTACEEVPFQRLSIAEKTSTLPVWRVDGGEDAAEVGLADLAHAGGPLDDLDERLGGVGVAVELAQLVARRRAGWA